MWEYRGTDHNNDWLIHWKYIDKKMVNGKWRYVYDKAKDALQVKTTTTRNADGSVTTTKGNKIFSTSSTTSKVKTKDVPKNQRSAAVLVNGQLYVEKKNKKKNKGKNFISRFLSKAITTEKHTTSTTTHINGKPVTKKNKRK